MRNPSNPFADNDLLSRADVQKAVLDLFAPLLHCFSKGSARVKVGHTAAHFDSHAAELEGFARPLWGIVPLVAGGADFPHWELYHAGLSNGTNPKHPEFWGTPNDYDQRLVEMAAIGYALLMTPEHIWQPLSADAQNNLVQWLNTINTRKVVDSNWLWFRILVNLGLKNVGVAYDAALMNQALNRLDDFYLGDGWYSDGNNHQRDYYIPFAMHFYALIYAKYAESDDPQRAQRYRDRATAFAQEFVHWFSADGSALPFGRSLSYRFAQGGFWGALAFANVEALPWGIIRGLALRHLRWWSQQPIFNPDGTLSIGYTYPNLNMAEQYNSPGSPYWALKFFLPLALPESHPFWEAEELPLPDLPSIQEQPKPYMMMCSDGSRANVIALTSGQSEPWIRHAGEKYAKFAYSTAFGFSVPIGRRGLTQTAADSMLAISDDGEFYRVRERVLESEMKQGELWSRWQAMPDVEVETWLIPVSLWHIRVHCIHTKRPIWTAEGGFALDRSGDDPIEKAGRQDANDRVAFASYPAGGSGIVDLLSRRSGLVIRTDPNTNIMKPRTVLPSLIAQFKAGDHWLACAVLADPNPEKWETLWQNVPQLPDFIKDTIPQYER